MEKKKPAPKKTVDPHKELLNTVYGLLDLTEHRVLNKFDAILGSITDSLVSLGKEVAEMKEDIKEIDRCEQADRTENLLNKTRSEFSHYQNKMYGVDQLKEKHEELERSLLQVKDALPEIPRLGKKLALLDERQAEAEKLEKFAAEKNFELISKLEDKDRQTRQRLAMLKEDMDSRNGALVGMISDCKSLACKEHGRADEVRNEILEKLQSAIQENARFDNERQLEFKDFEKGQDKLIEACINRLSEFSSVTDSLKISVADVMGRIDFAECQGDRLRRMERDCDRFDQMIKELFKKAKGK